MDWLFNTLDKYSIAIFRAFGAYTRLFQSAPAAVVIACILLPILALRWALPYWAFLALSAVLLVASAWITLRFIAACIDTREWR